MTKQVIALCFMALIGCSMAVEIAESSIPSMAISNVPRGILSQIAARIAADGPLDDIFSLFTTLEQTIRKEQIDHDALSQKQQKECKAELEFRNKEISDATSALSRATDEKLSCETSLHQAQTELKTNKKITADTKSNLQQKVDGRKEQKAAFDKNQANTKEALAAVEEGARLIEGLYSGSATLIEVAQMSSKLFTAGISINRAHHFGAVISAMAQIAQKSELLIDNNVLERIKDLFTQLRDRLLAAQQKDQKAEAESIAVFEKEQTRLKNKLAELKTQREALKKSIFELKNCVLKANNIITLATTKKERNSSLLKSAQAMCKNFEDEYKTASAARKEELALVDKLRSVCAKKLKFSKGVTDRATQEKKDFKKYQNEATIKGPKTWTKRGGKYDAAGAAQTGFKKDDELARLI